MLTDMPKKIEYVIEIGKYKKYLLKKNSKLYNSMITKYSR